MTQPGTPLESFRHAVSALLSGTPPNGVAPADVAEWGETLSQLYAAHAAGGTPAVVRTWNALTAADKRLLRLVSSEASAEPAQQPHIISAVELMQKVFPPVKWVVPDILPEGVTIFAGKPKMGKSWLAYNLAIATASGGYALGRIPVEQGAALYLSLEDTERRLQARMQKLLQGRPPPPALGLSLTWPRMAEETYGLTYLDAWLCQHTDARLVIVDTLAKVRPKRGKNSDIYEDDYNAMQGMKQLADRHAVGIVVVHHTRKGVSDDPLETISGSFGLTGGVDGVLVLKRERGAADAFLHVTGRDVEEKELALEWSTEQALWTIAGDADEYRMSTERRQIINVLTGVSGGMSPKEIADALDRPVGAIKKLLRDMFADGQVRQVGYGRYVVG